VCTSAGPQTTAIFPPAFLVWTISAASWRTSSPLGRSELTSLDMKPKNVFTLGPLRGDHLDSGRCL